MARAEAGIRSADPIEWRIALVTAVPLCLLYGAVISLSGGSPVAIATLPALLLTVTFVTNLQLAFIALIASLFVPVGFGPFSPAIWMSVLFAVAFILHFREFAWRDLATPMDKGILTFALCTIPSFLNAARPELSLLLLYNVVAFLIVFYGTFYSIRSGIGRTVSVFTYLLLAGSNALFVITLGVLGNQRAFGFAGIMFVDYAGLAVVVTAVSALATRGRKRVFLAALALLFVAALVFTQTRSIWLATALTLGFVALFLLKRPGVVGMTRGRLAAVAFGGLLLIGIFGFVASTVNPEIGERAVQITDASQNDIAASGRAGSSLVTRALIWDTAWNAFRAHPFIGVGLYAFSYSSQSYRTIPRLLYDLHVRGVSAHQTHISILAETGILGAIGFLAFAVAALRTALSFVRRDAPAHTPVEEVAGAAGVIYCFTSMFVTDAWLWGQGIVLLGLVLGFSSAKNALTRPVSTRASQ